MRLSVLISFFVFSFAAFGLLNPFGPSDLLGAEPPQLPAGQPSKPNIIVILADDLGYGDLHCYGANYPTPAIDQLAAEGFRSTDMNLPANVCGPSRSALLTGRYPMRNGHPYYWSNYQTKNGSTYALHPDEITLAEMLKSAGYRTFMLGKWHLGFKTEGAHPMDCGFDAYYGCPSNYGSEKSIYRDRERVEQNVPFEKITPGYNREIVKFIEQQSKDEPFFIYMAHQIAHSPIKPSKAFKGKTKKGKYADFVTELDDSVGQVMTALRANDLEKNTLVVFLSDNGATKAGSNKPLDGGKYTTFEGGHRVPGIFHWPGTIPAEQVSDTTISSMDLFPLFAGVAGAALPTDRKIDGKDIRNILMGKTSDSPHEFLYYYNGLNLQAVRKGKWKLHVPRTLEAQPYWGKKTARRFTELSEPFLVDLENDIAEQTDVSSSNREVVAMLLQEARNARGELGDFEVTGSDQRPSWPPVNSSVQETPKPKSKQRARKKSPSN